MYVMQLDFSVNKSDTTFKLCPVERDKLSSDALQCTVHSIQLPPQTTVIALNYIK